jgi:CBS domain-containing protein
VSPDDSVEVAAEKFWQHRIHRAPVVDGGRLVGVVTSLQFVRLFAEHRVKVVS